MKNSILVLRGIKAFLNASDDLPYAQRWEYASLVNGAVTAQRFR